MQTNLFGDKDVREDILNGIRNRIVKAVLVK